ncbi:hypothetical protein ACIG5E_09835 [Kitasatospora sp. NPDC053057]
MRSARRNNYAAPSAEEKRTFLKSFPLLANVSAISTLADFLRTVPAR